MTVTKREVGTEFRNVKFLLTSKMRSQLLLTIYEDAKNLDELRNELDKPSATVLHGLKELEEINLVKKSKRYYELTSNGYLLATNMKKLIENWYTIEKNNQFWNNHDLNGIPEDLQRKIYLLKEAEYEKSTTRDLSNTFKQYIELISKAKELQIILPIYSENHIRQIVKLIENNQIEKLEIILTRDILNSIRKNQYFNEYILENKKIKIISLKKSLKVFLTKSETFMSLSLFFKDGYYDDSEMLVDKTENGIKWAELLFNYYNQRKVIRK